MAGKREVRLNRDTDMLKLIAIITMCVDHVGVVFFPGVATFRIIGRIAFPLFCYSMAVGCCYTRSMGGYAFRLLLAALISQPFYALALGHVNADMRALTFAETPLLDGLLWYLNSFRACNIMVVLLMGQLVIWTLKEKQYALTAVLTFVIVYIDSLGVITSSYGLRGVALIVMFWLFIDKPLASLLWTAGYMIWWGLRSAGYSLLGVSFGVQTFAIMALPLIYLPLNRHIRMPKAVFYAFYPAHLALLLFLKEIL